ncbi:MAG TPA: hypothetical protein VN457_01290 [Chlamydiales bacterium]|nr:hypothetical protein [Chlamydiales bacterium]
MDVKKMLEKMAHLEFVNDQVVAELQSTDQLLRRIGFADGLSSVKSAAQEIYEQERKYDHEKKKDYSS